MSYHELTRIYEACASAEQFQHYALKWLEQKAQEMRLKLWRDSEHSRPYIKIFEDEMREILGLDHVVSGNKMVSECKHSNEPGLMTVCHKCFPEAFAKEEAPREQKTWPCEHMHLKPKQMNWTFDAGIGIDNNWNADLYRFAFCPICGAKRPEPRKALWQRLYAIDGWVNYEQGCKKMATAALEWFRELVIDLKGDGYVVDVNDLLRRLDAERGK